MLKEVFLSFIQDAHNKLEYAITSVDVFFIFLYFSFIKYYIECFVS
jgi:hypothetical protein